MNHVLLGVAFLLIAQTVFAQTFLESYGDDCGADYLGKTWTCRASDIAIASVTELDWAGDPESTGCVLGETLNLNSMTVEYSINGSPRYDLSLYIGEQTGTDPRGFAGAGSCSVFSLPGPFAPGNPTPGLPFGDVDGDQCGDLGVQVTSASQTYNDIVVTCMDNDEDGWADLNILLTWDNNAGVDCGVGGNLNFPTGGGTRAKCDYEVDNSQVPIVEGPVLEMAKSVLNPNGGNETAASFNNLLTITGIDGTHNGGFGYSDGDTDITLQDGVTYTLSETPISGYTLTDITCIDRNDGNAVITINDQFTAQNGQDILCTFTNTDIAPTLILFKSVTAGTAGTDEFDLQVTGNDGQSGNCGQDGQTDYNDTGSGDAVSPVESNCNYVITETPVTGYALQQITCEDTDTSAGVPYDTTTGFVMSEGQNVACTVSNAEIPASGSITLIKQINGGTAVVGDFSLRIVGDDGQTGDCGEDGQTAYTSPHLVTSPQFLCTYTFSEDDPTVTPGGYSQSAIICQDDQLQTVGSASNGAWQFTFNRGDVITCTVTNDLITAQLAMTKTVDGGTANPDEWTLSALLGPSSPISGAGGFASTEVEPGTYVLDETGGPAGYVPGEWGCLDDQQQTVTLVNGNELTLAGGDDVTCSITNFFEELDLVKTVADIAIVDSVTRLVTYTVTANNLGNGLATYDLIDTIAPGAGISVQSAKLISYNPGTENSQTGTLAGPLPYGFVTGATLVTGEELGGGLNESWTIEVVFSMELSDTNGTLECAENRDAFGTGFYNRIDGSDTDPNLDNNSACVGPNLKDLARFNVTKTFDDNNDSLVKVALDCNTGLPSSDTAFVIPGDPVGHTFVVMDHRLGDLNCWVIEDDDLFGYDSHYTAGVRDGQAVRISDSEPTPGCYYEGVIGGTFTCEISNKVKTVPVTVIKEWELLNQVTEPTIMSVDVRLWCNAEIENGTLNVSSGNYFFDFTLDGNDSETVNVWPEYPSSQCWAEEDRQPSQVEVTNGCGRSESTAELIISAGSGDSCTIRNTVFFEGIPTLSQYGLALLALLTLGIGIVAMRRFV